MVKDQPEPPKKVPPVTCPPKNSTPVPVKPKKKCTPKQLENLKNGREKSSLYQRLKQKKV
jgi:hypothetical protein